MKIVTFACENEPHLHRLGSLISDSQLVDLTSIISKRSLTAEEVNTCFDLDGAFLEAPRNISDGSPCIDLASVNLCAPVPRPGKVICIGLNYRDHAEESGMAIPKSPIIFSKFPSCVIGPGKAIVIPTGSDQVDYEAELAVVIGRRVKNITADEALDAVFGYTNFNDVSARDFQFADGQWQRGKSCDTFAPMGPFIATKDELPDAEGLRIRFRRNRETLQDSNTGQLIFGIAELIEFLSRSITLEPGDVIATDTPPGVGFARKPPIFLRPGDIAEVEIEGLGTLSNPVSN